MVSCFPSSASALRYRTALFTVKPNRHSPSPFTPHLILAYNTSCGLSVAHSVLAAGETMMSTPFRPRLTSLSAILVLFLTSAAFAQHDPNGVTGGGMIGGSTGRP